ncbi:unnamed protein product, partial [Protopolystoma xenopodis]
MLIGLSEILNMHSCPKSLTDSSYLPLAHNSNQTCFGSGTSNPISISSASGSCSTSNSVLRSLTGAIRGSRIAEAIANQTAGGFCSSTRQSLLLGQAPVHHSGHSPLSTCVSPTLATVTASVASCKSPRGNHVALPTLSWRSHSQPPPGSSKLICGLRFSSTESSGQVLPLLPSDSVSPSDDEDPDPSHSPAGGGSVCSTMSPISMTASGLNNSGGAARRDLAVPKTRYSRSNTREGLSSSSSNSSLGGGWVGSASGSGAGRRRGHGLSGAIGDSRNQAATEGQFGLLRSASLRLDNLLTTRDEPVMRNSYASQIAEVNTCGFLRGSSTEASPRLTRVRAFSGRRTNVETTGLISSSRPAAVFTAISNTTLSTASGGRFISSTLTGELQSTTTATVVAPTTTTLGRLHETQPLASPRLGPSPEGREQ